MRQFTAPGEGVDGADETMCRGGAQRVDQHGHCAVGGRHEADAKGPGALFLPGVATGSTLHREPHLATARAVGRVAGRFHITFGAELLYVFEHIGLAAPAAARKHGPAASSEMLRDFSKDASLLLCHGSGSFPLRLRADPLTFSEEMCEATIHDPAQCGACVHRRSLLHARETRVGIFLRSVEAVLQHVVRTEVFVDGRGEIPECCNKEPFLGDLPAGVPVLERALHGLLEEHR